MNYNKFSFKDLVLSDIKRKYNALSQNFPENKVKLCIMILIFVIGSKGFRSIFFHRLINSRLANNSFFYYIFTFLRWISFSIVIPRSTQIGPGFLIGHHECIVINGDCKIGKNCTIQQGVTLGGNMGKIVDGREAPVIHNNVFIGPGAIILGPVIIGENCIIGANSVVLKDIPKDSLAVGIPANAIKKIEENYIAIEKNNKKRIMDKSNVQTEL